MAEIRLEGENTPDAASGMMQDLETLASRTPEGSLVARAAPEGAEPSTEASPPGRSMWLVLAGLLAAAFWIAGVLAFSIGENGLAGLMALPVTGAASLAFVTVGPALFIVLAAVLIAELIRFRNTAHVIGAMAERFSDPAKATRSDVAAMAQAVRDEIARVNGAVEGALARLGAMEEVLGHHGEAFAAAETRARERTDALINDLRREREAVADLAIVLDQKAADIAEAITEQSKMVVAAADIANANALDSTRQLEHSAAQLTTCAQEAAEGAKAVAARLDEASGRLGSSTIALGDARKALAESTDELDQVGKNAQASFAASREEAQALTALTRQTMTETRDLAREGARLIGAAFEEVLEKARSSVQKVQEDTSEAVQLSARQTRELQDSAEQARAALEAYADVIAKRLEQANEASFSAAGWAEKTFEKLEKATRDLEEKLAALPRTADEQARDLQDKLQRGLAGLNAAARSAADEAEEIDAAFQARIRQNYELLSDFMLRMGAAADSRGGALDVPSPFAAEAPAARQTTAQPMATPPEATPEATSEAAPQAAPDAARPGDDSAAAGPESTAKPRKISFARAQIKAQEEARKRAQEQQASADGKTAEPSPRAQGWRWKDVLSGMDLAKDQRPQAPAPTPVDAAAPDPLDRLATLFRIHDIDPRALFNSQVYRSLAHARLVGGAQAMRDIVRMEAPDAIRALSDAFADDASLKDAAESFAADLRGKIDRAAGQRSQAHLETYLRTGDGPAWLLIETALG